MGVGGGLKWFLGGKSRSGYQKESEWIQCRQNLDICCYGEKNKIECKGKNNCFKLENVCITETY